VAVSTQNQALNALVFLYREVIGQEFGVLGEYDRPQRRERVPVLRRETLGVYPGCQPGGVVPGNPPAAPAPPPVPEPSRVPRSSPETQSDRCIPPPVDRRPPLWTVPLSLVAHAPVQQPNPWQTKRFDAGPQDRDDRRTGTSFL